MTRTLIATLVLLILAAATVAYADHAPAGPISDKQVLADRPDIAAVIYAAALEMRGQAPSNPKVTFAPAARQALRADGFEYSGFGRPRFTLMRMVESETDPTQVELGAVLTFFDALLRRTSASVLLTCTWSANGQFISVDAAKAYRITPPQVQMLLCIVPADRVPNDLLVSNSHAKLLSWIIANRATDAELASGDADTCYLFAICYDRLNDGAKLGIRISDEPGGLTGQAGNCRDLNYAGWHIAAMPGRFDWNGPTPFHAKIVHTPSTPAGTPRVIGILSSHLTPVYADKQSSAEPPTGFDNAISLPCAPDEDFIRSLYHSITHREPTAQELAAQVGRLQSGTSRKNMVQYFFASPGYVNQNHDSVRFITDACQAIYGRQPTEGELAAWPRTWRSAILEKMFKDPAHLAATQNCEAKWRKASSADPSQAAAYKAYIAAYNGLTTLMAEGKGDTPEAKAAYQKFILSKIAYEKALSGSTPRSPEPGTGNDIPPAADALATSAPAPAAGKTQVPATSARIAAAPVSPIIHQTRLLNSIPPSPWNRENVFSRGDTIYVWVESKVLYEPHTLEIVWVDPSGKEIKRETFDLHGWGAGESIWSELKTSQQMMQGQWAISLLTDGREERAVSFILNP